MLNDKILHKWVNGTLSTEELETFKQRPEYDLLITIYKNTDHLSAPEFDEKTMLAEILKHEKSAKLKVENNKRRFLPQWIKYAAAASVLILATWFFWPNESRVVYELAEGEKKEGVLPDQSMFTLNGASILSYDANVWNKERSLDLKGEAFFSVQPGSKFTVKTPSGSVQVLGTQFNVWARNGALEVKCQSGKVAVFSTEGKVLKELNPKDAVRIVSNKITDQWQLQAADKASWTAQISSFKKVKLVLVLKALERQFKVNIEVGNVDTTEIISCNFQHENLALALKTCLSPLGVKYEIQDKDRVVLSKE